MSLTPNTTSPATTTSTTPLSSSSATFPTTDQASVEAPPLESPSKRSKKNEPEAVEQKTSKEKEDIGPNGSKTIPRYVLHQTDRDPTSGTYAGKRIWTFDGDFDIECYDVNNRLLHVRSVTDREKNHLFYLPRDTKLDRDLLEEGLMAQWSVCQKMWKDDDNYTDYWPAIYDTLEDMKADRLKILRPENWHSYCPLLFPAPDQAAKQS